MKTYPEFRQVFEDLKGCFRIFHQCGFSDFEVEIMVAVRFLNASRSSRCLVTGSLSCIVETFTLTEEVAGISPAVTTRSWFRCSLKHKPPIDDAAIFLGDRDEVGWRAQTQLWVIHRTSVGTRKLSVGRRMIGWKCR